MFAEDELLPISALQHLLFCERQCALIHIERLWVENRLTVEGRNLHEKAHTGRGQTRDKTRTSRGLPLQSLRLGLMGVADVVEFTVGRPGDPPGSPLPFPIEYKRGRPKRHSADLVQLCAQALCLEEMLHVDVPEGAIFYGRTKRRLAVRFDSQLRNLTQDTARRLHELIATGRTPPGRFEKRCKQCSLIEHCLPEATGPSRSASRFFRRAVLGALKDETGEEGSTT